MLLLGYLYAHLLATRVSPRRGAVLHVGVVAVALAATLAAPRDVRRCTPRPAGDPRAARDPAGRHRARRPRDDRHDSAGLVLVRARPRVDDPGADPRDPYWLYALSNGGSLVSLLAYPLLIEPRLGLAAQRTWWASGSRCSPRSSRSRPSAPGGAAAGRRAGPERARPRRDAAGRRAIAAGRTVTGRDRLRWLALAAIPAGLLSAVTNLVTTDLISAPLLWVIPLAVYLASFVIAFSARGRRVVPLFIALAPATLTLLWVPIGSAAGWPILPLLLIEYAGLGIVAVALHGRLADLPPGRAPPDRVLPRDVGGRRARRRIRRARRSGRVRRCLGVPDPDRGRARRPRGDVPAAARRAGRSGHSCSAVRRSRLMPVPGRRRCRSWRVHGRHRRAWPTRLRRDGCSWAASCSCSAVEPRFLADHDDGRPVSRRSSWRRRPVFRDRSFFGVTEVTRGRGQRRR